MSSIKTVILAGGQGARFWPMSRMKRPKQFLSMNPTGESLLQATVRRVEPLTEKGSLWIITNALHESLIREHAPTAKVVCEPVAKNTAASIGLAAIHLRKEGGDPVMLVLPADHAVKNEEILLQAFREAAELAEKKDLLVTLGVSPTFPNTAYGYIKRGRKVNGNPRAFAVSRFFEKPNLERASKYFEQGGFYWNSGMFLWRVSVILEAIEEHMPELYEGLLKIEKAIGTKEEAHVTKDVFESLESISIDFGILEMSKNCAVLVADSFGWNDVGSWDAWAENFQKDQQGNLKYGDALVIDGENNVVHSKNRHIAVLGVSDLVVIDLGDALLICPRSRVQDVRRVVDELKKSGRDELI